MPANDLIFQRLHAATDAELAAIAAALDEKLIGERAVDVALLSKELRSDAASAFEIGKGDHELPYRRVLEVVVPKAADVAGWKAPPIDAAAADVWLEDYIVQAFAFGHRKKDATPAESKAAQTAAEQAILGKTTESDRDGFARAASSAASSLFRAHPAAIVAGLALMGGAMAVAWIAGAATRKVVPAVLVLIHVRHRTEVEQTLGEAA